MNKSGDSLAAEVGKKHPFDLLEQETMLNLARTFAVLMADFHRLFKEFGISDAQYNALRILRGQGEPMPVYHVAERMITPQPDITRLIDRLEQSGLAHRHRCENDRRVIYVQLTDQGRKLLGELDEPVLALHRRQFGHLPRADLTRLNELLFRARQSSTSQTIPPH